MAVIHRAQLTPSKIELIRAWVPAQPWLGSVDTSTLDQVDAYRFDDPAGEVGVETHLIAAADGRVLQVPLTYRDAPLAGAEAFLITTMDHSVLGQRWVYDACCDPVYVRALATTITTGGSEAELMFDGSPDPRPVTAHVSGNGGALPPVDGTVACSTLGTDTVITAGALELTVIRVIDPHRNSDGARLTGTWSGQPDPVLLAFAR